MFSKFPTANAAIHNQQQLSYQKSCYTDKALANAERMLRVQKILCSFEEALFQAYTALGLALTSPGPAHAYTLASFPFSVDYEYAAGHYRCTIKFCLTEDSTFRKEIKHRLVVCCDAKPCYATPETYVSRGTILAFTTARPYKNLFPTHKGVSDLAYAKGAFRVDLLEEALLSHPAILPTMLCRLGDEESLPQLPLLGSDTHKFELFTAKEVILWGLEVARAHPDTYIARRYIELWGAYDTVDK